MRPALVLLLAVSGLWAQFRHLATTDDGSRLYFSSTLPLGGTAAAADARIFVFESQGTRLFARQESCSLGWTGASGDGAMVAFSGRMSPDGAFQANLAMGNGSIFWTTVGQGAISGNGRYVLFVPGDGTATEFDLIGGGGFTVPVDAALPLDAGVRTVASDGTVVLRGAGEILVLRSGGVQHFAIDDAPISASIDDNGDAAVYETSGGIFLLDVASGAQAAIDPGGGQPRLSNDGRTLLYLAPDESGVMQVRVGARLLTAEPGGVVEAALSGDGGTAYAITASGRVLRIDTGSGAMRDLTPAILAAPGASQAPPAPGDTTLRILSFSNDPVYSTASGAVVTLKWDTRNAASVVITGPGAPSGELPVRGSVEVRPVSNTIYTLIAYGVNGGSVSAPLYVFVR